MGPAPWHGESPTTKGPEGTPPGVGRYPRGSESAPLSSRKPTLSLEIHVAHPGGSSLVDDYLSGEGPARSLFPHDWTDLGAYRAKAEEVAARFDREARAEIVRGVTAPFPEGDSRLARWVDEGGFMVTTGQQPGLFGGPLYSLYKAITAVRLAQRLETLLERPVLPLFWVASEDHDWEEAHDTWLIGVDNELHHLEALPPQRSEQNLPLHRVHPSLDGVMDQLPALLPETEFRRPYLESLHRCWTPEADLSRAFRRQLEELLGPLGLLFVEADDPYIKDASRSVLLREAGHSATAEAQLAERAATLEAFEYPVQVPILEGGVNLFMEGPAGRERLYRDGDGFHLRHSEARVSVEELDRAIDADPSSVSPNVLLRPVVETAVLPTLAYVGGPGEIAYFAQLSPLFELHGLAMPVVVPRRSVVLIEAKIRKKLDKFDLDPGELQRPFHELASEIAREELPDEISAALTRVRAAVREEIQHVGSHAIGIDPTLEHPVERAGRAASDVIDEIEKKVVQALKRNNETALFQLEKAGLHLFPGGKPQERVLNPLYFLVRYGEDFLQDLVDRLDPALPGADPDG